MSDAKKAGIKMVKVIYKGSIGMSTVYGSTLVGGAPINYGYHKDGDVFEVSVDDVMAQPSRFTAWPCDRAFTIKNGKLDVPCGEMEPEDKASTIEGLPGIGKKTAQKLAKMGITTQDDVLYRVDDEILNSLPPMSRKAIKKWQVEQKA